MKGKRANYTNYIYRRLADADHKKGQAKRHITRKGKKWEDRTKGKGKSRIGTKETVSIEEITRNVERWEELNKVIIKAQEEIDDILEQIDRIEIKLSQEKISEIRDSLQL